MTYPNFFVFLVLAEQKARHEETAENEEEIHTDPPSLIPNHRDLMKKNTRV
jgi:hypothetical protein